MDGMNARDSQITIQELEWSDIREPGCYLHLGSGLLARVSEEELAEIGHRGGMAGRVARLADNPHLPLTTLRLTAMRFGYRVSF